MRMIDREEEIHTSQPEPLTDDDFETIRIHLNAYKEKLCNQRRWKEAEEYQRIIDRFMAFASVHPEIIRCGECSEWRKIDGQTYRNGNERTCCSFHCVTGRYFYCGEAERRTDAAK